MTFLISLALFDKGEGVMSCDTLHYNVQTLQKNRMSNIEIMHAFLDLNELDMSCHPLSYF